MTILSLENKVAIVTGGSKGLGKLIATSLLKRKVKVWICSRNKNELIRIHNESEYKSLLKYMVVDVADSEQVKVFIEKILQLEDKIDFLINNASIYGPKGPIEEISWDDFKETIEVNLYGSINFIRFILPHFKKNNYGKVIQLADGGAT